VDNAVNPKYNPNPSCTARPTQVKCYQYIAPDGTYTNEPQTCGEEICSAVEYCDVNLSGCTAQTTSEEETTCQSVESCDGDQGDTCECVDVEVCTGGVDYTANPYDYANMECVNADGSSGWAFTDGSNPRYVKGLCAAPAINLSGNTILEGECGDATPAWTPSRSTSTSTTTREGRAETPRP
jgi:hypothetical protein